MSIISFFCATVMRVYFCRSDLAAQRRALITWVVIHIFTFVIRLRERERETEREREREREREEFSNGTVSTSYC